MIFGFSKTQLLIVAVAIALAMKWAQGQTRANKPLPLLG